MERLRKMQEQLKSERQIWQAKKAERKEMLVIALIVLTMVMVLIWMMHLPINPLRMMAGLLMELALVQAILSFKS